MITYIMKNMSKQFLLDKGFRYSRYLSDYGDEVYTYRFPVIKYGKTTTIECEISVSLMTNIVNINVYSSGTKELYSPYYDREFGSYEIIKSIDIKIKNKMKELNIEET